MNPELQRDLLAALERSHRLGTIGGDLTEQLAHCAGFSAVLGESLRPGLSEFQAVDLGTGGGLPGLVLAALHRESTWVLVEMRSARADEVERAVLRLGLGDRVEVVASEAQLLGHEPTMRESFDVVVARAFGPPSLTAECAAGLVRVGGTVIISEPPSEASDDAARWDANGLEALGLTEPRAHRAGGHRFASFDKVAPVDERIPRLPPRTSRGWLSSR